MTPLGLHRPAPLLLGAAAAVVLATTACSAGSTAEPPPAPAATRPVAAPSATQPPATLPPTTRPATVPPSATVRPAAATSAPRRSASAPRRTSTAPPRRRAPKPAPSRTGALADRISDPQLAADRMVRAWVAGDLAAAKTAGAAAAVELFKEPSPGKVPPRDGCQFVQPMLFVCGYVVGPRAQLTLGVTGGASVGYVVTGVQWGD